MKSTCILIAAAATATLLASCAAISSVPPGPTKTGSATVVVESEWADISAIVPGRSKKVRVLSLDGPLLNRLYLTDGLIAGDYLVKPAAKERPTPTIRAGMSNSERVEFVTDSVSAMDYQRVRASKLRPAKFDGEPAIRMDLDAVTTSGLAFRGTAVTADIKGKTYVVLFLAPSEHYFEASLKEVEAVMASAHAGGR